MSTKSNSAYDRPSRPTSDSLHQEPTGISTSESEIHLHKTLCAMRWIALMTGKRDVTHAIEKDLLNFIGVQR